MCNYSLRRVAQYARYHYTSMRNNYLMMLLVMVGLPALFGIMNRTSLVAVDCAGAIYLLGGVAFAYRQTFMLRDRGSHILEGTLPVSALERFTFMLVNLTVILPACSIITGLLSILIVTPFCYVDINLAVSDFFDNYLAIWQIYCVAQIISSLCLMLNLLAGRRLLLTYLIANVSFILLVYGLIRTLDDVTMVVEVPRGMEDVIAVVLLTAPIVIFYGLAYLLLRRRQVKW